jgi:hypothetical protein
MRLLKNSYTYFLSVRKPLFFFVPSDLLTLGCMRSAYLLMERVRALEFANSFKISMAKEPMMIPASASDFARFDSFSSSD